MVACSGDSGYELWGTIHGGSQDPTSFRSRSPGTLATEARSVTTVNVEKSAQVRLALGQATDPSAFAVSYFETTTGFVVWHQQGE